MTLEEDGHAPSVRVTLDAIYQQVLAIDKKLDPIPNVVTDHEKRIREIEEREDLTRRVTVLETKIDEIGRKVWAIPGSAVLIAGAALVVTLVKAF